MSLFGMIKNKRIMETDVKQRIIDLINIKADSIYAFAKAINVRQTTISDYLNNGKTPSWQVLRGIITAYPDISVEWLLRGTGNSCYIDERDNIDIVRGDESQELKDAKATITRLSEENEALKRQIIELRAVNEYQDKRLDKMIAILHQEPPYNIAADNETPYNK